MLDQHASDACAHGAGPRPVAIFQRVLEPLADNPGECRIGVAHRTKRIGCAEAHRARTGAKADTSVEEPPMLRSVVRCRMSEAYADRCDVRSLFRSRGERERHC